MRRPMDGRTRAVVMIAVSFLMLAVAGVLYTNYRVTSNQTSNDRRWCTMLGALDDAYKANPPTTKTGKTIADETAHLRVQFGCLQ